MRLGCISDIGLDSPKASGHPLFSPWGISREGDLLTSVKCISQQRDRSSLGPGGGAVSKGCHAHQGDGGYHLFIAILWASHLWDVIHWLQVLGKWQPLIPDPLSLLLAVIGVCINFRCLNSIWSLSWYSSLINIANRLTFHYHTKVLFKQFF